MTEEKFKQIQKLQEKIDNKKRRIRILNVLINDNCELSCKVSGKKDGAFRDSYEHFMLNNDEVIKLLKLYKEVFENELSELEELFSKL